MPDGSRCAAKRDALNSIYAITVDRGFFDKSPGAVAASAGGDEYGLGHWHRIAAVPPDSEIQNRPPRGFFKD